jgi:hypothetical protein
MGVTDGREKKQRATVPLYMGKSKSCICVYNSALSFHEFWRTGNVDPQVHSSRITATSNN